MNARHFGELIGYTLSQTLIFALIIGAVVYFARRRAHGFVKTVLSWKVWLPALLIVGLINLPKIRAISDSARTNEPYSAAQIKAIKAGCVETASKKGQPTEKVDAYCDCSVNEIKQAYPTYQEADAALSTAQGVPEQLKPKMQACAQKVFATASTPATEATESTATNNTAQWRPEEQAKYTDTCVTSFKAKGANDSAANAACHCVAAEAQKIYPTYSALEQAYVEAKGAPEALKPRMMACVQKAKS